MVSILVIGAAVASAETNEPGPFERFFRSIRRAFNEPQHKSSVHHVRHKQTQGTGTAGATGANSDRGSGNGNSASNDGSNVGKPPNENNTRSASKAVTKKGEDLPYGTPVAGKQGFVTSPFSPNSGYIDVRGFAPGTPVKDPYTGKVFLTP